MKDRKKIKNGKEKNAIPEDSGYKDFTVENKGDIETDKVVLVMQVQQMQNVLMA